MAFFHVVGNAFVNTENVAYVKNGHETFTTIHLTNGKLLETTLPFEDVCNLITNAQYAEQEQEAELHYRERHKYG